MHTNVVREVIVIDAGIADWKTLVAGLSPDIAVILLPAGGNALAALALALEDYGQLDALHLVTHGSPGQLRLGQLRLNTDNLPEQHEALAEIASHLGPHADVLLYGCSVADGMEGKVFVNALSVALDGVNVAASVDVTGALSLGGDWDLEYWAGQIDTVLPFAAEDIVEYNAATMGDDAFPAPTVTSMMRLNANPTNSDSASFGVVFDQGVKNLDASDFSLVALNSGSARGTISAVTGSGTSYTVTVSGIGGSGAFVLVLRANTDVYVDQPGASSPANPYTSGPAYTVGPALVSSVAVPVNGVSKLGDQLDFTVTYRDPVTVTGTPSLGLTFNTGGTVKADYVSGSGTTGLLFRYTVASGQQDTDGISLANSIALNGGSLKFGAANTSLALNGVPALTGVRVDAIAPTVAITSNVSQLKIGETATITFTFSEDPGSSFVLGDVTVTGGTLDAISGTGLTRTATFTPANGVNNGTASITVASGAYLDAAGNQGGAGSSPTMTIDTIAPTLAITSDVASLSIGDTASITFTFSEDPGTSFVVGDIALSGGTLGALTGSGLTRSATFTPDGNAQSASITVAAGAYTDVAGNNGAAAASPSLTIDSAAPSIASITRVGSATSSASTVDYLVTFSESVSGVDAADFSLTLTGTADGAIAAISGSGSSYTVTVNNLSGDGIVRLDLNSSGTGIQNGAAVAIAGGYSAGQTYTLDHTAPAAPAAPVMTSGTDTGSSHSDAITSNTTPSFTGVGEANATVTLYDSDGTTVLGSTTAGIGGNWQIASSALAAGEHTLSVKQRDAAGNVSPQSSSLLVTIDNAISAPAAPALASSSDSGTAGDNRTSVLTPLVTGTAEAYASVTLYASDGVTILGTGSADGEGAWGITSSTLGEGAHSLFAMQTDRAGNVSLASAGLALAIDATAPGAPSAPRLAAGSDSGSAGDGITQVRSPVFTGSAEAGATVRLYDSDGATLLGSASADGAGTWSIASGTLALGAHTLTARQTDAAGNMSLAGSALNLTIEARPAPPPPPPPAVPTTSIDGVQVTQQPVILPGGGAGTQTAIPIIGADRNDSSGSSSVADIPLVTGNGGSHLLLAQLATGFGLTASGGASQSAGNARDTLIQAILAATPAQPGAGQGELTADGVMFLDQLLASVPLLVHTLTPISGARAPAGALTLTGTSTDLQHTALVIDASGLADGSTMVLNSVDFAAMIGSAKVIGNTRGQILAGDAASQQFTVSAGSGSAVLAGGGNDILVFNPAAAVPANSGGMVRAMVAPGAVDRVILHGGQGADTAAFSGAASAYTVENHHGYLVVTANAQPSQQAVVINAEFLQFSDATMAVSEHATLGVIVGLYQNVLERQADYLGISFWAGVEQRGLSLGGVALALIGSAESQALRAATFNGDSAHDIALLYQGIFGRDSDAGGLGFWVGQMARGMTLEQVATSLLTSPEISVHQIGVQERDFLIG